MIFMRRFAFLFFAVACTSAFCRELTSYAVVLTDAPALASAFRSDAAALAQARTAARRSHESVKAALRGKGALVTGEVDTVMNAIFVNADAAQVDQLKALPGVAYVAKMPKFKLELDAAVQLINVPAAWSLLGGTSNAGAGIKIAVIDTGIDQTHAAFQDTTLTPPANFPRCDVPANCAFTNAKVIVARSYVSMLAAGSGAVPAANSRPDDLTARDHVGHGTAVAMAAAGQTNTGFPDTITGVAPKAFLGSYKVFGSPGVNDFTSGAAIIAALEAAFNDGMNIAVLSLGGTAFSGPTDTGAACGNPANQPCDPIAAAVQDVVNRGMVVVAAAGNAGATGSTKPTLGTVASPGDAPGAIAVAATTNSHIFTNSVTVNGLGSFNAQFGNGPLPTTVLNAPLSDVANVGDPLACSAPPAGSLAGTVALAQRGTCTFVTKVQNLQVAGAVGVIITNSNGDNSLVTAGGLSGTTSIPAVFIGYDDGQSIRGYLRANPSATVSVSPNVVTTSVSTYNQVASFSSRGPVLGGGSVKPDVAAVGTDIYLAAQHYDPNGDLYSANGYIVSQGTSFSAPQIAGVAALVLQAHPGWTPAQVKSAVVNNATQDITDGGVTASVLAVGAGKANAAASVTDNLTASPSSISFGILKSSTVSVTQAIQLVNTSAAPLNLTVTVNRRTAETNAHVSIDLPNLTIAAGQTGTINATLSGTLPVSGDYEGFITIQGAATSLQIPFLYVAGDGVPASIISVIGDGDNGIPGQSNSEGGILLQLLDRYGVPVSGYPIKFATTSGGGKITAADPSTDTNGFAGANDVLASVAGTNVFTATAGSLSTTFTIVSTIQPTINPAGAVNAASFAVGGGMAPGSFISLFGTGLSSLTMGASMVPLQLSMNTVSVSFDTPSQSVPGRLVFVSPGQVNVQVPWELQTSLNAGQTSAQIKVSAMGNSGAVYFLPLASYSPAFFEATPGTTAALDQNFALITASNPVAQGTVAQFFVNGLGPVNNQPASGDGAPFAPNLATTVGTPTVTIGGIKAPVQFSGLAPSLVGLYQVNAVVPNTGAGNQPVTISIGGVQSVISHVAVK